MNKLHVLPTPDEAALAAEEFVTTLGDHCVATQGRFTVALSGGSRPRLLYEKLASPVFAQRIKWNRWHVFWGDERCVAGPQGQQLSGNVHWFLAKSAAIDLGELTERRSCVTG